MQALPGESSGEGAGTCLVAAALEGDAPLVRLLLGAGVDANKARGSDGVTPLFAASWKGSAECAELLLGAGADATRGTTARFVYGADPDMDYLESGATPLHVAACTGTREVLELLLGAGAALDCTTEVQGETPLYCASFYEHAGCVDDPRADRHLVGLVAKDLLH